MTVGVACGNIDQDAASRQLLEAAKARCNALWVDPARFELAIDDGRAVVAYGGDTALRFDALIARGLNWGADTNFQVEVFELLEREGVVVVNSTRALSISESKPQTSYLLGRAGIPTPDTVVTGDAKAAIAAVRRFGTAVLKPLYGALGAGVQRVEASMKECEIDALLAAQSPLYVQRFVPNRGGDVRAFVLGGRVLAAIRRTAPKGEWRANVHQGAAVEAIHLAPELESLAIAAARAIEMDYTGVDLIEGADGPVVLEVNGAPAWAGVMAATGMDIPGLLVEFVIAKATSGRP